MYQQWGDQQERICKERTTETTRTVYYRVKYFVRNTQQQHNANRVLSPPDPHHQNSSALACALGPCPRHPRMFLHFPFSMPVDPVPPPLRQIQSTFPAFCFVVLCCASALQTLLQLLVPAAGRYSAPIFICRFWNKRLPVVVCLLQALQRAPSL